MNGPRPLWSLGIAALGAGYADGSLDPVQVLESCLGRIAALDPTLNVFVHLDVEGAGNAAMAARESLARHRRHGTMPSPLLGVPVGIKDIVEVAGLPMTCGSRVLAGNVPDRDAAVVETLREVGAVILGKVATHEFANGLPSLDLPDPPARNPWNPGHHPGGSSSGCGAGVAAGFFALGIGSDTGGSVRHPASACGVVGLKASYGAISRRGVFPLAPTLDHVGLITRDAADAALALGALARPDPREPSSIRPPWTPADLGAAAEATGLRGLRVGFVRHFHEVDMPADPAVAAGLERAAALLAGAGAEVADCALAPATEYFGVNRVILHAEAWAIHARWLRDRPERYGLTQREALVVGAFLDAGDLVRAQMRRAELVAQMTETFSRFDILLCASSMDPAGRFDDPAGTARTYGRQARTPFNVTGHPAIALMSGLAGNGLPVAIQLAAAAFAEPLLLRVARAYEALRGPAPQPPLPYPAP